ncbi:molybdate ABC transporter, membrane protein, putative [Syntrophotalea carbinolica DSM 2380]|uniref:Molybdenum transport system permease n=1 Tax=Syntrophotalea carbinolica (strain DSM 2380 / NBRC 103641 / GraBd1) TaxID=338963 RepID=Q3A801_SYNC1|nr:molybdate ABC transporter permease subunit [Syntrophotalea carbinolica]ABA87491.1 molybdate ABC transporter, membrane protein, putative [Syntrophotalea carbinolica DSM 2380]
MITPIVLSIKVALLAVSIDAVLGTLLARALARRSFPGKNLVESCIMLPMVLPPTVLGYGLLILLGKRGLLGRLLQEMFGLQIVFTWWAAIVAAAVVSFPLMYQSAKAAFCSVDVSLEQAARTLGSGEGRVFLRVTLPLAYPGLLAGLVLAFARALGEFGATLMIAGNIPGKTQTIPLAIYFAVETGDNQLARNLVLAITVMAFGALFWLNSWSKKKLQTLQQGGDVRVKSSHS